MNLIICMIRDIAMIVSQKVTVAILDNWSLVLMEILNQGQRNYLSPDLFQKFRYCQLIN